MSNDKGKLNGLKLSRRSFLGSAALGAVAIGGTAVAASALTPAFASAATGAGLKGGTPAVRRESASVSKAASLPVPSNWSQTADVVVVGYVGAGAVTAITAHDLGANVLYLRRRRATHRWGSPVLAFQEEEAIPR